MNLPDRGAAGWSLGKDMTVKTVTFQVSRGFGIHCTISFGVADISALAIRLTRRGQIDAGSAAAFDIAAAAGHYSA